MRRANGAGSIFKVKGKLRNPWRARITVGWEVDELTGKTKQIVKGYDFVQYSSNYHLRCSDSHYYFDF